MLTCRVWQDPACLRHRNFTPFKTPQFLPFSMRELVDGLNLPQTSSTRRIDLDVRGGARLGGQSGSVAETIPYNTSTVAEHIQWADV
jgi:hypothetical protein